ncbi:PaaI family thioesterase [Mycolicibacterium vaccae]|uniref:PaaI family thioesterase n=1 Tax=Mycolicibacterium vaccae TaxID=1810 RepID=UPI003D080931
MSAEITQRLNRTAEALETFAVAESDRPFGNLHDVPGRGQAMSPTFTYDYLGSENLTGTVVFSDFYLGASAVHGGAIPLIFDEVLGRLANEQRPASRTAYLHVDYRRITPTDKVLRIDARVDRVDGRKVLVSGILRDGSTLLAEAEGLFVILRSDQP